MVFPSLGTPSPATATSCTISTATGKLSAAQVASVAYAAGFRGQALQIATAITEPESGADTTAVQQGEPTALTGVGLFQITPGQIPQDLDPLTNAKAAYAKYVAAGNSFTPWTTFTGGEYLAWLGWAAAGVATMSSTGLSCQAAPAQSVAQDDIASATVGKVVVEATPPGLPATFDSYPEGQCTYYVAMNHANVPAFLGNAAQWWTNGPAKGMQTSATPRVGWVVVYGSGGGYSADGHVAIVIQVDSATTFDVEEMNFVGTGVIDERTSSMTDVAGFLD